MLPVNYFNDYRMPYPKLVQRSEIQFVYPNPPVGGSKLIFFTPFRVGVNEGNKFAD
jgi:hypothetical protein